MGIMTQNHLSFDSQYHQLATKIISWYRSRRWNPKPFSATLSSSSHLTQVKVLILAILQFLFSCFWSNSSLIYYLQLFDKRPRRSGLGENCSTRTEGVLSGHPCCSNQEFPSHPEAWWRGLRPSFQGKNDLQDRCYKSCWLVICSAKKGEKIDLFRLIKWNQDCVLWKICNW